MPRILSTLLSLCCFLLTSCATIEIGVPEDALNYDTNPAPDAIVGIWTRVTTVPGYDFHTTQTLLFSPDGTGFTRAKMVGYGDDFQDIVEMTNGKNFGVTWRYAGGGWWDVNMESAGGHPNQDLKYRITSDPATGPTLHFIQDGRAISLTKVSDP